MGRLVAGGGEQSGSRRVYVLRLTPSGETAGKDSGGQSAAAWTAQKQSLSAGAAELTAERNRLIRTQQQANQSAGFLKSSDQAKQAQKQINELNRSLRTLNHEQVQLGETAEQGEVNRLKKNARESGSSYLQTLVTHGLQSDETRQAKRQWEAARQARQAAGASPVLRFANQVNAAASGLAGNFTQAAATTAGLLAKYGAPEEAAKQLEQLSETAQAASDRLTAEELRSDAAARYGLGKAGNVGMDATRMVIDQAMSLPFDLVSPELGRVLEVTDSVGAGARMAHQEGATLEGAAAYGLGTVGLTLLTGKLGKELSAVYGKKFAGEFVDSALAKAERSGVWRKGMRLVTDALGAGGAGVATAMLEPVVQSVYDRGEALSDTYGTPEGRKQLLQRAGEETLGRLFFSLTGRMISVPDGATGDRWIEKALAEDLQTGTKKTNGAQMETAVPGGKLRVLREPKGYTARVEDADGRVQHEQHGIPTAAAAAETAAEAGTAWVRQQPETQKLAAELERAWQAAPVAAEEGAARKDAPLLKERAATGQQPEAQRTGAAGKQSSAMALEEAETLLLKTGFDDPYGMEKYSRSAEEAALLAEAERIVNEAAKESALQQEQAMLHGGKEAAPEKGEDVAKLKPGQTFQSDKPMHTYEAEMQKQFTPATEYPVGEAARADPRNVWTKIKTRGTVKIQHGISAFPEEDAIARNVKAVPPVEGYFDFGCHGMPTSVAFGSHEPNMSPSLLAEYIRHHPDYTPGEGIRLLSCSTGKPQGVDYCFAEELANIMGVNVMAPSEDIFIRHDGTFCVGRNGKGEMIIYKPNDRRRLR